MLKVNVLVESDVQDVQKSLRAVVNRLKGLVYDDIARSTKLYRRFPLACVLRLFQATSACLAFRSPATSVSFRAHVTCLGPSRATNVNYPTASSLTSAAVTSIDVRVVECRRLGAAKMSSPR